MPDFYEWVQTLDDHASLSATDQALVRTAGGWRRSSIGDIVLSYSGFIDPHLFGAKGDGVYYEDGILTSGSTTFESVTHTFTAADVGKYFYCGPIGGRTISAVNVGGNARRITFSGAAAAATSSNNYWVSGTNDTAALRLALAAAGQNMGRGIAGATGPSSRNRNYGRLVVLRPGAIYLVMNTSAEYNNGAGTLAALPLLPRTGIVGMANSIRNAMIMATPDHRGHIIAPSALATNHDFLTIANVSIHGNGNVNASSSALDAIHMDVAMSGYMETDNFFDISTLDIVQPTRDGIYYRGRGEGYTTKVRILDARRHGLHCDQGMDSTFVAVNAGGCRNNAFRINKTASSRFVGCKGFYSGKYGASDVALSANWHIVGDHPQNSSSQFDACESQESRGSGVLLEGGYSMLNFRIADPGRETIRPGDAWPAVAAGIHMRGANCVGNEIRALIKPDLGYWDKDSGASTTNWGKGTNAVHIDSGPSNNSGTVKTMPGIDYPSGSGPFGGAGTSNGANTGLRVNNTALT